MGKKRIFYLDALRVLSILCVMGSHVVSSYWPVHPLGSPSWYVLNAYSAVLRLGVPALFMISGALMLSPEREISVCSLYTRSIPRILYRLLFWTALYAVSRTLFRLAAGTVRAGEALSFLLDCLSQPLHLWFLYVIIGLYIVTPLLRPLACQPLLLRYFVLLSLLFASLLPTLQQVFPALSFLKELTDRFYLRFVLGYSGCYMLGYLLSVSALSKRTERLLFAAGVLGLLFTFLGTLLMSRRGGCLNVAISDGPSINLILTAAGAFTLFKMRVSKWETNKRLAVWMEKFSENSFGMYLVHMFFIELFNVVGFSTELFTPVLSVPCVTISAFLLSAAFSFAAGRIPFAKKYLL